MKKIVQYKMIEIMKAIDGDFNPYWDSTDFPSISTEFGLENLHIRAQSTINTTLVDNVFAFMYGRFFNWYCYQKELDINESEDLTSDDKHNWLVKLVRIFTNTYDRYARLYAYYQASETLLMNQIETSSVNRINDTPQDTGLFDDDEHTTTIAQNISRSDFNTPIERLDEIRKKLHDIIFDWSEEFEMLFWVGDEYE